MKKLSLIIAACALSFLSLSSYANMTRTQEQCSVTHQAKAPCSTQQDSGRIEKFTAPNLVPDPRVNNS